MNRANQRKLNKLHGKKIYSFHDIQKATNIAIEMKKLSKGHLFKKALKERCVFCGATMKTRKECDYWFLTFMDRQQTVLLNPTFFHDNEIEALYIQHPYGAEDIKIPFHKGKKDA